jgi:hypothetical protein
LDSGNRGGQKEKWESNPEAAVGLAPANPKIDSENKLSKPQKSKDLSFKFLIITSDLILGSWSWMGDSQRL